MTTPIYKLPYTGQQILEALRELVNYDLSSLSSYTVQLDIRVDALSSYVLNLDSIEQALSADVYQNKNKLEKLNNGVQTTGQTSILLSAGNVGKIIETTASSTVTLYPPLTSDDFSDYDSKGITAAIDIVQIGTGTLTFSSSGNSLVFGDGASSGQYKGMCIYRRKSSNNWVIIGGTT